MIKLEFQLELKDHLTFQLYIASKSERIRKKRRTGKYRVPIVYLLSAVIIYFTGQAGISATFIGLGILWFLFYPMYEKKRFEKHYRSFVEENFKPELESTVAIELTETHINITDVKGNSSIVLQTMNEIDELKEYFFIRLSPGQGLILPKSKIDDMIEFEKWLNKITEKYQLKRNIDIEWKWK